MSPRNHWITFVGHQVVGWEAFLPAPRGDASGAIEVGRVLVDAGKRHAVWNTRRFESAAEFAANAHAAASERDQIPLVFRSVNSSITADLAFYRGERIVEETVADVGALLRELHPDRPASVVGSAPAVVVEGASVAIDHASEIRIEIRLDTDIWFPTVIGFGEPDDDDEGFDNRPLALRHTPRLDAFLSEVAAAVRLVGGRWSCLDVEGFGSRFYRQQWNEDGIAL